MKLWNEVATITHKKTHRLWVQRWIKVGRPSAYKLWILRSGVAWQLKMSFSGLFIPLSGMSPTGLSNFIFLEEEWSNPLCPGGSLRTTYNNGYYEHCVGPHPCFLFFLYWYEPFICSFCIGIKGFEKELFLDLQTGRFSEWDFLWLASQVLLRWHSLSRRHRKYSMIFEFWRYHTPCNKGKTVRYTYFTYPFSLTVRDTSPSKKMDSNQTIIVHILCLWTGFVYVISPSWRGLSEYFLKKKSKKICAIFNALLKHYI